MAAPAHINIITRDPETERIMQRQPSRNLLQQEQLEVDNIRRSIPQPPQPTPPQNIPDPAPPR